MRGRDGVEMGEEGLIVGEERGGREKRWILEEVGCCFWREKDERERERERLSDEGGAGGEQGERIGWETDLEKKKLEWKRWVGLERCWGWVEESPRALGRGRRR